MYATKTNNCVAAVTAREPTRCLPGRLCALALSTADGCLTCFNCPLGKLNALFTVYETHTIQLSPCLISARQSNRVSIRVDNCEIIFPSGFYDRNDFQWPRVRACASTVPATERNPTCDVYYKLCVWVLTIIYVINWLITVRNEINKVVVHRCQT